MRHDKLNNYSLVIQEEVTKHMQQWYAQPTLTTSSIVCIEVA